MTIIKEGDLTYILWTRVADIDQEWERLNDNLLLSLAYLKIFDERPPVGIKPFYVGFYRVDKFLGGAIFQLLKPNIKDLNARTKNILHAIIHKCMFHKLAKSVLFAGNITLSGDYSYFFDKTQLNETEFIVLWQQSIKDIQQLHNCSLTILKDFYAQSIDDELLISDYNYQAFHIEPNMILSIPSHWNNFESYLKHMTKKYKANVKNTQNRLQKLESVGLKKNVLSFDEIVAYEPQIYQMYREVSTKSSFNLLRLDPAYFSTLKNFLEDRFILVAYFMNDTLIGFYTLLQHHDLSFESHFLGYLPAYNTVHKLYFNMLIDMTKYCIDRQAKRIVYGRTALEIKSSVGAEPLDMMVYMKHRKAYINKIGTKLFNLYNPEQEKKFIQRHPFKKSLIDM